MTQLTQRPKNNKKDYKYIDFRKKISDRNKLNMIRKLADEWLLSETEVIERLIQEGLVREKARLAL